MISSNLLFAQGVGGLPQCRNNPHLQVHSNIITSMSRLSEGTYRITSEEYPGTVRVDNAGGELYVSSDERNPGPFELWTLKNARDGGYTIDNVGLNVIRMLDTFAAVRAPENAELVVTNRDATVFNIESAGDNPQTYVIKIQDRNVLWNVEPSNAPRADIKLRNTNGSSAQKWSFTAAEWPPV